MYGAGAVFFSGSGKKVPRAGSGSTTLSKDVPDIEFAGYPAILKAGYRISGKAYRVSARIPDIKKLPDIRHVPNFEQYNLALAIWDPT